MESSVIRVFSIISNIRESLKKNKEIDIDRLVFFKRLERMHDFLKKHYKRIYNEIENSFYTYVDLKLFCYHQIILNDRVKEQDINQKNVLAIKEEYTEKNIEFNKKVLIAIDNKMRLGSLKKYFMIRSNGISLIYELIKIKRYISVYFWILNDKFFKAHLDESAEHLKFRNSCILFKKQIKLFERSLYV